jgi:hypothetical protein
MDMMYDWQQLNGEFLKVAHSGQLMQFKQFVDYGYIPRSGNYSLYRTKGCGRK